jgi:MOSC domain-containing protein YiiM
MKSAVLLAVCKSKEKGTRKKSVESGLIKEEFGLVDDAHADCTTHRQISLLAEESIEKMRQMGLKVGPGDFAENLTTKGIDLPALPIGTRLQVGREVLLEVSQIGKECHTRCAIFQQVGTCVMPLEGVFARVIRGGVVKPGDLIEVEY